MRFVPFKFSRMQHAIENGEVATVTALLAKGVSPDLQDEYGRGFLWHAIDGDQREIAELLVEKGASLALTENNGATVLHRAARRGRFELAARFAELAPQLVNAKDAYGETPLHIAAEAGRDDMVQALLDRGADPTLKNSNGRNALFLAQREKHADVAQQLKRAMGLDAPRAVLEPADDWRKLSEERIAHVTLDAAIGYRITEIFNFASRERTTLFQNLETKAESNDTKAFEHLGDLTAVETAAAQLKARGGADVEVTGLQKKRLQP